MKRYLLAVLAAGFSVASLAQPSLPKACDKNRLLIPIEYGFKDVDAQAPWVYHSLKPSVSIGSETDSPLSIKIEDGVAKFAFCTKPTSQDTRLNFRAGPRSYELAPRPVTKGPNGQSTMATILLLNQVRPDWPVVQSIEQLDRSTSQLPSFDISIFNFGQPHGGGRVKFEALRLGSSCAFGSPPSRVEVQVSLVGQRLQVTSSDPEYPEEQITRAASLETAISNSCSFNYRLLADFGPTGKLSTGPNRIRYVLKEARAVDSVRSLLGYFSGGQIHVVGDGIW